jgi:predicted SnoaL-like aldol condensation-catalyzing enzyme
MSPQRLHDLRGILMPRLKLLAAAAVLALAPMAARAALPVTASTAEQQQAMLKSSDPRLAANKKLVYDVWREILLGGHVEKADQYLAPDYMQHNPMVDTGIGPFKAYFSSRPKREPPASIPNLVSIFAERDMVVMAFVRELPDPKDPAKKYTTTWFDMFRIANGKVAEHWDVATLPPAGQPPAPGPSAPRPAN